MRKCVFRTAFIREEIDPRVQRAWQETYETGAPFGKLRQMWKTVHCSKVDPYNTGCPYSESDCGMAFLIAVERTVGAHPDRPTGYFRAVALTLGLDRADNKPLARDIVRRMDVRKEGHTTGPRRSPTEGLPRTRPMDARTGDDRLRAGGLDEGPVVHGANHRPQRIGELLGNLDLRPHQRPTKDVQEGNKR